MPGYYTHQRIFIDAYTHLTEKKRKSPATASAAALLGSKEFFHAALFGLIGPNLFDFIPRRNRRIVMGHELSFILHNGRSFDQVHAMLDHLYEYRDKNSYWAAMQRACFLGYSAHLVADTVFHPFIYYWSGFPDTLSRREMYSYREQNLLFTYNIDNYYLHRDERREDLITSPEKILPLYHKGRRRGLHPSLKDFIIRSIQDSMPEYTGMIARTGRIAEQERFDSVFSWLDFLPFFWKRAMKLQRRHEGKIASLLKEVRMRKLFYSDFIIQYPHPRFFNGDALNFHRDRWNYPAGRPGYLYESVEDLRRQAVEFTVDVWEKVETSLFDSTKREYPQYLQNNCYTGVRDQGYRDMHLKSPLRIHA